MPQKAKVFIYARPHHGEPKLDDFELKVEELDPLKDDEFLAEAMYFGINAGLRAYQEIYPVESIIVGGQVARVLESKNQNFPVGSIIYGLFGWRSHTVVTPANFAPHNLYILPDFGGLPHSLGIGYLSMPGNTAYFGLLELCKPKAGETVLISTAAGSVGSLVGQIAKIKGCKVVGITSSEEKCRWLEDELGFDKTINYKTCDIRKALKEAAPEGIDCYFDNVGGEISSIVMQKMNNFGRIAVCGGVSFYNAEAEEKFVFSEKHIIGKQLKIEGFIVYRWADRWMEAINQNLRWIQEGKVKFRETMTEGFENLPQAFIDLLRGKNFGKGVVKV